MDFEDKKEKPDQVDRMNHIKRAVLNSRPPEELSDARMSEPPKKAAGIKAVFVAAQHMLREMPPGRANAALLKLNQKDGYDCPGCAWPDPDHERSSLGEYCENGAKAIAEEATTKLVDEAFFEKHSIDSLAKLSDFELGKSGRITRPFYLDKNSNHYKPISWDKALDITAQTLKGLKNPNEAVFYTSGRTSNEAAFLYQLFVRRFGTNNLPDCSNMCHESSGVALSETIGIGKGSVTLDDFDKADLILVAGQNPGTNHPRMLKALAQAKRNGAKIISINPLIESGLMKFKDPQRALDFISGGESLSDLFLQVKLHEDMALFKAFNKLLLEKALDQPEVIDSEFVKNRTSGFDEFKESLAKFDLNDLIQRSGIAPDLVKSTADIIANSKKIIACWAMGLTQHTQGVETIQELVNLLLLKGSIGKEGAGACPVRGHSNVQGDRTMGIYEKPSSDFIDRLERTFKFSAPRAEGYDVVESIKAMKEDKVKVFMAMGGNFLSATPDTEFTAEGLARCELTIHVSTKLNRSHLVHGKEALILPCLGRSDKDVQKGIEQFVSVENSMGVVHKSRGRLKPISEQLLSEVNIICELALRCFDKDSIAWRAFSSDYNLIRDEIAKTIPGFEDFNKKMENPSGFYLPNTAREGSFIPLQGKARFSSVKLPDNRVKEGELVLMTIRTHDQFNTTIYGMDDRYRGIKNERRVLLINEEDIKERGLKEGDVVDLLNDEFGSKRIARKFILKAYNIPKGNVASYFPETNVLIPIQRVANRSNTPASKFVPITLHKSASN